MRNGYFNAARSGCCIAIFRSKFDFIRTVSRAPFGTAGFARMIGRAGTLAKLGFKAHPHTLGYRAPYWRARCRGSASSSCVSDACLGPQAFVVPSPAALGAPAFAKPNAHFVPPIGNDLFTLVRQGWAFVARPAKENT